MFIDEIYNSMVVEDNARLTTAHIEVYRQKVKPNSSLMVFKQIENGYQLFRRKNNSELYPEESFRRYCFMRWSKGRTNLPLASKAFRALGWKVNPKWLEE